jgi:hypothetical protein
MRMAFHLLVFQFIDPFAAYSNRGLTSYSLEEARNNPIALKGLTSFACYGNKGL